MLMQTAVSLPERDLVRFLDRHRASAALVPPRDFSLHLHEILNKAAELVPSESGSVLLYDPQETANGQGELVFVAAFGPASAQVVGERVPASQGVVGTVYSSGAPHLSRAVCEDERFSPEIDLRTGHVTTSLVAVPISVGVRVCGVIELVNRRGQPQFDERDLALLEIFAGYTSSALLNALDAHRAHELAKRDDLSGLANDRWLHYRLVGVLMESAGTGSETALIFLDLDGLKSVNDRYGHLAGAQVLREIGRILREVVRDEQALVARYGGDEFVAALPRTTCAAATALAESIRAAIAGNTFLDVPHDGLPALHLRGVISASVGVASDIPTPGPNPAPAHLRELDLLRRADAAMYQAKAAGKNQVVAAGELAPEVGRSS